MNRLTINETWEQCLAMWKWISRQCKGKSRFWCSKNIDRLKEEWLGLNGVAGDDIDHNCFFCEYDDRSRVSGCCSCPGRKVEHGFDCGNSPYDFAAYPRLFYAELKRLNKIRLAK